MTKDSYGRVVVAAMVIGLSLVGCVNPPTKAQPNERVGPRASAAETTVGSAGGIDSISGVPDPLLDPSVKGVSIAEIEATIGRDFPLPRSSEPGAVKKAIVFAQDGQFDVGILFSNGVKMAVASVEANVRGNYEQDAARDPGDRARVRLETVGGKLVQFEPGGVENTRAGEVVEPAWAVWNEEGMNCHLQAPATRENSLEWMRSAIASVRP